MPAAVIFDNDGLTLDTEHTWTRAEAALYARYGTQFTLDHKREMLGTSGEKSALTMERHLGQPGRGDELRVELRELVHDELDGTGVEPMPGVVELLEALGEHGIPLGLATNSGREFATRALRAAGLYDRFAAVVSAEDVERPKPAPDVYLAAAAELGAEPQDVLRTRLLLASGADWEAAVRAHREAFTGIDPANTSYYVAGFIPNGVLVEVELDAIVPEPEPPR
jgi:HAD superfamily hydrolase (TIGR01509 family)